MLQTIDDQGTLQWHCLTPTCAYHNCRNWDQGITCIHHPNQYNEPAGQSRTAHINDPEVQWISKNEIVLPSCPGCQCNSRTVLRVHDDEELTPPIITTDELTGKIVQVAPHPHPKFSGNLWFVDKDIVRKRVPHPTLAHLSHDQIEEMQAYNRRLAPDMPVAWMMTEAIHEDIHSVSPHPAVERHRELARQLRAMGKEYTPPEALE